MTPDTNQVAFEAWNGDRGHRWVAEAAPRDRALDLVGEALMESAALVSGESVLDIGCGCGATTISAARAVGSEGTVLGVDLSEPMLEVASRRAAEAGLTNIAILQADAQAHPLAARSHDAAISRFGTMFFEDPGAAFANVERSLRVGGRLCIATWQPLLANEWLTVPGAVLLHYGTWPESPDADGSGPGMFAQSDPARLRNVLHGAGLRDVGVKPAIVPLRLGGDAKEATAYLADTGVGRAMLATIPEDDRRHALDAVTAMLADHTTDRGVHLDGAVWITTAIAAP